MTSSKPAPDQPFALYGYFRSSASFRVRIALNLKGIQPDHVPVHLLKNGGEQHGEAYRAVNPQGLVPALCHGNHVISQSLAIIEYLDEIVPEPPLLPRDALGRARVRELAYAIACDIHPLNNLRVLRHLRSSHGFDDEDAIAWQRHWISIGFQALETMLSRGLETGRFCHGNAPTLADICLVPQMRNARRVQLDLASYPTLTRIEAEALALAPFARAQPENQPDAE